MDHCSFRMFEGLKLKQRGLASDSGLVGLGLVGLGLVRLQLLSVWSSFISGFTQITTKLRVACVLRCVCLALHEERKSREWR